MLVCLWKGCTFAFDELTAFQEHVITKHALQKQRQLNLDKQNDVGTEEEKEHREPMTKKAKMHEEEENKKMIKIREAGKRKLIFLAIEVWVDVLGFIKRIQLARTVCLVNFKIYEICWPRLHGDKVLAHIAPSHIAIGYSDAFAAGHTPKALLLKDLKNVPFPECAPPDYITGFGQIHIKFLDHQVLAFLSLIAPRITTEELQIQLTTEMGHMDENQRASVNRLLQMFREKITTISSLHFNCSLSNLQFLPDMDNNVERIECSEIQESDIPVLMQFLASPRSDGKQRVMMTRFLRLPVAQKFLDAIKEEFRTSTQPVPQPFFLQFLTTLNIPQSEEQNQQTDETLTIRPSPRGRWLHFYICRHPRGQHEQCAEDARKRLIEIDDYTTHIHVDISEVVPFSMDSI